MERHTAEYLRDFVLFPKVKFNKLFLFVCLCFYNYPPNFLFLAFDWTRSFGESYRSCDPSAFSSSRISSRYSRGILYSGSSKVGWLRYWTFCSKGIYNKSYYYYLSMFPLLPRLIALTIILFLFVLTNSFCLFIFGFEAQPHLPHSTSVHHYYYRYSKFPIF